MIPAPTPQEGVIRRLQELGWVAQTAMIPNPRPSWIPDEYRPTHGGDSPMIWPEVVELHGGVYGYARVTPEVLYLDEWGRMPRGEDHPHRLHTEPVSVPTRAANVLLRMYPVASSIV